MEALVDGGDFLVLAACRVVEGGGSEGNERGGISKLAPAHRRGLDGCAGGKEVADIVCIGRRKENTPVRDALDNALRGQPSEGLAEGIARAVKALGRLDLAELLARLELAGGDGLAQLGGDRLGKHDHNCTKKLCTSH